MTDRLQEIRERLDGWHQKSDSIASKKDRIGGDPILLAALLSGSLLIRKAASDIRWLLERVEELENKKCIHDIAKEFSESLGGLEYEDD